MSRTLATIGLLLCVSQAFAAEVGWRGESRYVATLQGSPSRPAASASPRNEVVVAWADVGRDGSTDIFASVRDGSIYFGMPVTVNTTAAGDQLHPRVARAATGQAVVVWASGDDVVAQRLSAHLDLVGPEIPVSSGKGIHTDPAVATDAFGNFVVVWRRSRDGNIELVARRFAADGAPVGPVFVVSTPSSVPSGAASISMAARGDFAVAWPRAGQGADDVFVGAFAADGTALSEIASVGATPALQRRAPALAMDAHGGFVVAWASMDASGASMILARQYLPGGSPLAPEFAVASAGIDAQSQPAVAIDASGDFGVSWDVASLSGRELFAQIFTPAGARQGAEAKLGPYWLSAPALSMDADGDATVLAVHQWGSQQEIRAVSVVGPEPIDVELAISEDIDPVVVHERVSYTITVTNRHAGGSETGIPEIDSAIGGIDSTSVFLSHGGTRANYWLCPDEGDWLRCPMGPLAAGAVHRWVVDVIPYELPAVGIYAWLDDGNFADPAPDNNSDVEETAVVCANGQGAGVVRITQAPTTIDEGQTVVVEVERSGGSCGDVTVYTSWGSGQLQWADGEVGARRMTLSNLNPQDNVDEDPQTGQFRLYLPQGGVVLGEPSRVSYTLTDDEPEPTVSITPASVVRSEGDSNYAVDFLVTLSHPSTRKPVVRFSLGGTATRDSDYRLWSPQGEEVTFYGSYVAERISVHLIKDSAIERDETVVLTLTEASRAVVSAQATGTLTIEDDDSPLVRLVGSDVVRAEGTTTPNLMVALSRPVTVPITVPLLWTGSARNGEDFTAPTSVTIPAGYGQADLQIPVLRDGLDEDPETAVLTLGTPSAGRLDTDTSYSLSITDMDPTPTLTFVERAQKGVEGATLVLAAELSAVSGREVRVALVRSGPAQPGSDYSLSDESIVIPAGTKVSGPILTLTDDAQVETPETVTFSMGAMTNALAGEQTEQAVVILDNDPTISP